MAYTRNWDESQPQDHTKLSDVPSWMRAIKIDVAQRLKDWIYGFISGETKIGLKKAPLHPVSSDPATESDKGILYVKEVDGVKELFYKDSSGNVKQLTVEGKLNIETDEASVLNVDKVDGYDASTTPQANTIPVANGDGHINNWINQGEGSGLNADLLRGLPADFTCSKNQNGYTKLPNGLILQWLKYYHPGNAGVVNSYTFIANFPIPFPNAVFAVSVNGGGGFGVNWTQECLYILELTTSYVKVHVIASNDKSYDDLPQNFYIIAIGH